MNVLRRYLLFAVRCLPVVLGLAALLPAAAAAREVTLPVEPDAAYVQRLVVSQIFTDAGRTARVWVDGDGCNFLILSDPLVDTVDGRLRIRSATHARVGQPIAGRCIVVSEWQGTLETFHEVALGEAASVVSFRVVDSNLVDSDARRGLPLGVLWDWIKDYAHPRLGAVRMDLGPTLEDVKSVLGLMLQADRQLDDPGATSVLETLVPRSVAVTDSGLRIDLAMTLPAPRERSPGPAPALTAAELARFESAWQAWDGFITFVVKELASGISEPQARQDLLRILIEARYDLLDILTSGEPAAREDPVRRLFLDTWSRLSPVLRRMSPRLPQERALNLLSFVTAADALETLDALGPSLDLDISLDGLRRMARILAPQAPGDPLEYNESVDPRLRELFNFGPPLPTRSDSGRAPGFFPPGFTPAAHAAPARGSAVVAQLNKWVPPPEGVEPYLRSVHALLVETADGLLAEDRLDPELHEFYRLLLLATAWQETCWRHYKKVDSEIVPIRSAAGAVGLMQVVPRVWRGFYDPGELTSDIAYNAAAGGEILMHYLVDYAIKRGEDRQPGGRDNLAWAAYAAYNGGPGQLERYRQSGAGERQRRVDEAFRQKFEAIRAGDELAVRACFDE